MTTPRRFQTLAVATLCLLLGISIAKAQYAGGSGTADDPYLIATAADLIALGETPDDYDKHFILTADIDLDPNLPGGWVFDRAVIAPDTDDGVTWFQGTPFRGVLDGYGHVISHVTIIGHDFLGLFGLLSTEAEVRNLGIVDVSIVGTGTSGEGVGALAGSNLFYDYGAGLWAASNGIISVAEKDWPNNDGILLNCYSTGSVISEYGCAGGLIGANTGTISQCHSSVIVHGEDGGAGGLAAYNEGDIADCHSHGSSSGENIVGGFLGSNNGTVSRCYSTGAVDGASEIGGLVGANNGRIAHCRSSSAVNGAQYVGGLVGANDMMNPYHTSMIIDSFSTGNVTGVESVGGLLGFNIFGGTVVRCWSDSKVTGGNQVGGLLGFNSTGILTQCYATGPVSATEYVGGLVGENRGWIKQCYSIGVVDGDRSVGGLTGYSSSSIHVTDCFWDVNVSGQSESAGGTGLTTPQMQSLQLFLDAGWDFIGEVGNGTSEVWAISQGSGYPVLTTFEGYEQPKLWGEGTPDEPYLISNALELGAMTYCDPRAYYRLNAPIDLSGIKWAVPVIWQFAGHFDGHGYAICSLTIEGENSAGLFGTLEPGAEVSDVGVGFVDVSGLYHVGGIAGLNWGVVGRCYSAGTIRGIYPGVFDGGTGGLVGENRGTVTDCLSMGTVGEHRIAGGLVGRNKSRIMNCYSTSRIDGQDEGGGLVGSNHGTILASFWDIDSSGTSKSSGGVGLPTSQMKTASTFLEAGWDFIDETENGTEDVWWIDEGRDYPRLWWEREEEQPVQ